MKLSRKKYMKNYGKNYRIFNKNKIKKEKKHYYEKNKTTILEKNRHARLKRIYGITFDQYNNMLNQQNNSCAICKTVKLDETLAVDHSHVNGKIRGLLCYNCNTSLGKFQDNITTLESAIQYLKKYQS